MVQVHSIVHLGTIWPLDMRHARTDVTRKQYKIMPRFSDLRYDEYPPAPKPLNSCVGTIRCRRVVTLHRFARDSKVPANQDIHLLGNRRMGGDSTHHFAYLSYTSHLGATNIQRPYIGGPRLTIVCTLHHVAPSWCHRRGERGRGTGSRRRVRCGSGGWGVKGHREDGLTLPLGLHRRIGVFEAGRGTWVVRLVVFFCGKASSTRPFRSPLSCPAA